MKFYSKYAFKRSASKAISSIKWFLLKWLIILLALVVGSWWLLYSSTGDSVSLIADFKQAIRTKISVYKEAKSNAIEAKVRQALGVPTKGAAGAQNPTYTKADGPLAPDVSIVPSPVYTPQQTVSDNLNLPEIKLGFYYDNTNAPASLQESLAIIEQAAAVWKSTCGITFEFKGEKHADYVSTAKTLAGNVGIIKWTSQFQDSDAIGEAHMGSESGPVKNFVLALNSHYFNTKNVDTLRTTLIHEMGHVIGLDHSNNDNSIMFFQSQSGQAMQSSDKAMCLYLRARWSGVSSSKAAAEYGLVF